MPVSAAAVGLTDVHTGGLAAPTTPTLGLRVNAGRPPPPPLSTSWAHVLRPPVLRVPVSPLGTLGPGLRALDGRRAPVTCSPRCATSKASCSLILSSSLMPPPGPAAWAGVDFRACLSRFRLSSTFLTDCRTSDTVS